MADENTPTQNASWHDGFSPEDKGFLQLKGWDKHPDANTALGAVLGSYREAEKKLGVPADRLVRWPEANDADGMKPILQRLGVPADAQGYDFSNVKFSDGTPIEKDFETFMRETSLKHGIPKEAAAHMANAILSYGEQAEASERAARTVTAQAEDIKLRADWSGNYDVFKAVVNRFLENAPFTPEQKDAFTSSAQGMKLLYAVASSDREAQFHGAPGGGGTPAGGKPNMSREEAGQALEMKKADPVWMKRYRDGEPSAIQDFVDLTTLMAGVPVRR